MKELIFSKQFPRDEAPDIPPGRIFSIFDYISPNVYDKLIFVPIPGREEIEKLFMLKAIKLSQKYKYDIRIFTAKGATEICLSFDYLSSYSELPYLIGMADSISLHSGIYGRDHTVRAILYTHDIYRNGKRVLPDPEV